MRLVDQQQTQRYNFRYVPLSSEDLHGVDGAVNQGQVQNAVTLRSVERRHCFQPERNAARTVTGFQCIHTLVRVQDRLEGENRRVRLTCKTHEPTRHSLRTKFCHGSLSIKPASSRLFVYKSTCLNTISPNVFHRPVSTSGRTRKHEHNTRTGTGARALTGFVSGRENEGSHVSQDIIRHRHGGLGGRRCNRRRLRRHRTDLQVQHGCEHVQCRRFLLCTEVYYLQHSRV
jgi:hypothetical protein